MIALVSVFDNLVDDYQNALDVGSFRNIALMS
jgi:hypothetical protein